MLPFYIAVALFFRRHGKPPRKAEHAALLEAVRTTHAHLNIAPSKNPAVALDQLQASAEVRSTAGRYCPI
jgi:hypothetical protein